MRYRRQKSKPVVGNYICNLYVIFSSVFLSTKHGYIYTLTPEKNNRYTRELK